MKEDFLDPILVAELKNKVENLKRVIAKIEKEFKRKGKAEFIGEDVYYVREAGIFFDPAKYASEMNLLVGRKALETLDTLYEIFPYIPYEDFRRNIERSKLVEYNRKDKIFKYQDTPKMECLEWCKFYPSNHPFSELNPIFSLINLCDKIDEPDVIRELQKPLYVALSYVFSRGKIIFSKEDFSELRSVVFDHAIALGMRKGWIIETGKKGVYKIEKKPDFISIICPSCQKDISAYNSFCPVCGLYLLNMVTYDQKQTESSLPDNLFRVNEKETEWIAYFKLTPPIEEIKLGKIKLIEETVHYKLGVVFYIAIKRALEAKLISEIPDYSMYAKNYTKMFHNLIKMDVYEGYYEVKGESLEEVQRKLNEILNIFREEVERDYLRHEEFIEGLDEKINKDDFLKEALRICYSCFNPRLDKHPILSLSRTSITGTLQCPKCGTEMPKGAQYCGVCGSKLKKKTQV